MLPKRRKPKPLGCREAPQIRSAGHLKWIRGFRCCVNTGACSIDRIEAAHVRTGTDGSLSVKPSDCWTIPLCFYHHAEQHRLGEATFEREYKIDMKKLAAELWAKSPHRQKLMRTT